MRVVSSEVEEIGDGLLRIITVLAPTEPSPEGDAGVPLGAGPDRATVPDRVVRFLISCGPDGAQLSEIQRAIGGNPRTANRQIWTLGTGGQDLPVRLRGWVEAKGNGRYALSDAAWERLGTPEWRLLIQGEMRQALEATLHHIPDVVLATERWQAAIEGGGDPSAARLASDEGLFKLLGDAKQANTMFGEARGWDTTASKAPLILWLERTGIAYRLGVHAPTPSKRLEALAYLSTNTQNALDVLDQAFEDGAHD